MDAYPPQTHSERLSFNDIKKDSSLFSYEQNHLVMSFTLTLGKGMMLRKRTQCFRKKASCHAMLYYSGFHTTSKNV